MSMIGADVEQLAGLGRTLTNQVQSIESVMSLGRQRPGQHAVARPGPRPVRGRLVEPAAPAGLTRISWTPRGAPVLRLSSVRSVDDQTAA